MPITTTTSASVLSMPRVRLKASSWRAGTDPRPSPLRNTGTRSASAAASSASLAPSHHTSDPAMIAGRWAPASSFAACCTASGSGSAPAGVDAGGISHSAIPNTTSIGKSRNTGPRCGVRARRTASATAPGICSVASTVAACLVIGASSGTWSNSWSEPDPHRACGARPPRTSSGAPLKPALVMALMPLVTPGPAVSTATPTVRVSFADASAANVAVCS